MIDRKYISARVGNMEQMAFARRSTISQGKADGLRVIEIDSGGGLSCTLLESRCLDIARLAYCGINLGFLAKPGLVSPNYYSPVDGEFLRYFQAGMLYTCGLDNVGPNIKTDKGALPMHGRIGITPAEAVNAYVDWDNGFININGRVYQNSLFGENLILERNIRVPISGKEIIINDSIENSGFKEEEIMLLYHFNFGWPLLSEDSLLKIEDDEYVMPRDDEAKKGIDKWNTFEVPKSEYPEQVFYHKPRSSSDGLAHAIVWNNKLSLGVDLSFDAMVLPYIIEWKSMASGDYALGIEPSTCLVGGHDEEKKAGRVQLLEPGGKKKITIRFKILED